MKILVVDDSRVMRMIVARALRSTRTFADATVVEAASGSEALELVGSEQPDVVLSDWNMPQMSGLELLEALRQRGEHRPLGFVTSESTPAVYDRAMAAGARFLVSKPFTAEALERALASVV